MRNRNASLAKSRPAGTRIRTTAIGSVVALTLALSSASTNADVLDLVRAAPEGSWLRANLNSMWEVWTPPAFRNDAGVQGDAINSIIQSWSSFAWDSSRSNLIIYGGGHANYSGNDVYTWNGSTLLWERSSLPSKVVVGNVNGYNYGFPADGSLNAPASAHTYDNSVYLRTADRYLTFGGGAFNNGNAYVKQNPDQTYSVTGPYLFDPSRADPNKVGGTSGSGVNPATLGSQAWSNRDTYTTSPSLGKPWSFIDGVSDAVVVGGKDVVYIGGSYAGTLVHLFRYTINDLNDPALDTWEAVGADQYGLTIGNAAGALAPGRNIFVRTGDAAKPFLAWNIATAGPANHNVILTPTDLTGGLAPASWSGYGLVYDPLRDHFVAWRGNGDVWKLDPPDGPFSESGWTVSKLDVNGGPIPDPQTTSGGVLGKWQYASDLDAFVGLQDSVNGNVWIYKPEGWIDPAAAVPETGTGLLMLVGSVLIAWRVRGRRARGHGRDLASTGLTREFRHSPGRSWR